MGRSHSYNFQLIFANWKFAFTVISVVVVGVLIRNTGIEKSSYFSDNYDPAHPIINPFFVSFVLGFIAIVVGFFLTGVLRRRMELEDQFRIFVSQCELLILRLREVECILDEDQIKNYPMEALRKCGENDVDKPYLILRTYILSRLDTFDASITTQFKTFLDALYVQSGAIRCSDIKIIPNSLYNLLIFTILFCVISSFLILLSMYGWIIGYLLTLPVYVVFIGVLETASSYHPGNRHYRHEHRDLYTKYVQKLHDL